MNVDALAQAFEELRPHLLSVAYSQLGSLAEAEDVVQESWLRLSRTEPGGIRDLRAWLTTVVGRLALDALGSARARRERYVGPWLPEPLVERPAEESDPAHRVTLDEGVSTALLVVLERLSPPERTAFVLHDVFGYSFEQVAEIVGRTPQASRQLASRARRRVAAGRPRQPVTIEQQRRIVEAFIAAAAGQDLEVLTRLLDPDVVLRSDGGGVVQAARRPLAGAARVARAVIALTRGEAEDATVELVHVNGRPGLLLDAMGIVSVIAFTAEAERITAIDIVRNPEKLGHVRGPTS